MMTTRVVRPPRVQKQQQISHLLLFESNRGHDSIPPSMSWHRSILDVSLPLDARMRFHVNMSC